MRAVVARLGLLRTGFDPLVLDREHFAQLHADGATDAQLATEFGISGHQVRRAIRAFGLPARQPRTGKTLPISDRQLAPLVAAGHSDADIADRYAVPVWAVTQRRRQRGLHRKPNQPRPPVSRARLMRQLEAGKSRADIATTHRVGLATVTRWCSYYGIDVGGASRPTGGHAAGLDPAELRRLYVTEQWSVRQIGAHFGVDDSLVTYALHSHRIPVRRGGPNAQASSVVVLDALYADADVVAALERHRVPLRRRGGRLAQRFPHPAPLDPVLGDELYRQLGLSATHISLLTGHTPTKVLETLRRHGIPARPSSRSPWYQRAVMS